MIQAVNKVFDADFALIDGDTVRLFDMAGLFMRDTTLDTNILTRRQVYKAISVLSSNGVVELCLFDESNEKKLSDLTAIERIIQKGGYFKRVQLNGTVQGIRYRQMVFVYMQDVNTRAIYNSL